MVKIVYFYVEHPVDQNFQVNICWDMTFNPRIISEFLMELSKIFSETDGRNRALDKARFGL